MATLSAGMRDRTREHAHPADPAKLPLIVDMDGFLVRADLSAETLVGELEGTVSRMTSAIRGNRGSINPAKIAEYARKGVDVSALPLQHDLVDYISACAEMGREIHLVTSAAQEIADAVHKQLLTLDYVPPFQFGHDLSFDLARRVAELLPGDLDYVFFANSGSEAIDTAMKIALQYHRSNGQAQRTRFEGGA